MTRSENPTYEPVDVPERSVAPTWEPVTLSEAKKRCDVAEAITIHDAELTSLIQEARERVEIDLATVAADGSFTWSLPEFPPRAIVLPFHNVTQIESIRYIEDGGSPLGTDLDDYQFVRQAVWPSIWPDVGQAFPVTEPDNRQAVKITFRAGWPDETTVPEQLKQAVLARVRWLFVREDLAAGAKAAYESIVNLSRAKYP